MNLIKSDWYDSLLDDISSTWTESVFISRWSLIEGYHAVGQRLRQDDDKMSSMTELVNKCAGDMGVSPRKLWYAVQFYDKFPDLDNLPGGKNISWSKIKTKYLPSEKKEKPEKEEIVQRVCPTCGQIWEGGEANV